MIGSLMAVSNGLRRPVAYPLRCPPMPTVPFAEEHDTLRRSVARLVDERLAPLAAKAEAGAPVHAEAVAAIADLRHLDDVLADVVVAQELGRVRSGGLVAVLLDNLLAADVGTQPAEVVAVARRADLRLDGEHGDGVLLSLVGGAVASAGLVVEHRVVVHADDGWEATPLSSPHALRGGALADVTLRHAAVRPVAVPSAVLQRAELREAAAAVGAGWVTFHDAVQYAGQRTAFGRPIGRFQVNRHALSEIATWLTAAEALVHDCAWALATRGAADTAAARLAAGSALRQAADVCLQLHGGNGYTTDFDAQRAWRDGRALAVGDDVRRQAVLDARRVVLR
jgi:alkylation response protein AidB-like acyl-CoA dehydrogenase